MKNIFSIRDKSILVGLYLSKFDEEALRALGFRGFNEAFNTLGYSIGSKPASIKNYRDEFDPLFPNPRKGWHKRPIRDYCKIFYDDFSKLNIGSFTELIKGFVFDNYDIEKLTEKVEKKDMSETVAKRLITGKAAEEYFKINYKLVPTFLNYEIKDTTNLACGFDYKLSLEENYYCVEVKGLNANSGGIALTEKEFYVANNLKKNYCLFVVKNFIEKPNHQYFFDPLNSNLTFKRVERKVTQINYSTAI
ncbi:MAG: protein NO VEIN domain-containing protein [Desulfocucumaceae bacterium]